ncbi:MULTISPECIES: TonB-dependent receptor [unclassified Sphingomonas]|uniref:TonB-dependent receptor plug domain-containing protein n=1 Tax=unclassified Sphingomonas TaxID=196159 RepID=UPI000928343D|nr:MULTISPECIES: TonB-dependent receptor [unclassified Sphingomonas]OJU17963.1 MAG: TonB-dependent receptor [Sphingomonas sp. 66-10]
MKLLYPIAGVALIAPSPLFAQSANQPPVSAPAPDAAATPDADGTVVVTAMRAPVAIDRVAASVTVLDKNAIDRAGDMSVSDLLLRTPGVTMSRNGGYGTATSLRIRGAESDQTVVVIDGVKLNDPSATGGGYNFANLLTGDAGRIEVLRGPQSILWGSQAIGGVVNVVTPLPEKRLEGSFDIEAGSRDTVSARAAIGGNDGPLAWRVGGQAFTTRGISAIAPDFGGRELDGYTNRSIAGRAVLTITPNVSAELRGYYANGRAGIDGFSGDTPEYTLNREFVGYAGLNVALLDGRFRNRFAYGYTNTDRDNYNPARARTLTFDAAGRNERLEYQGSFAIARGVDAVFGAENEVSRFRSVSPAASLSVPIPAPARGRAEITSFYGQLNAAVIAGLTLTAGVRNDDHSRYGGKTLFAGGGAWALPTGTVFRASYSEGFKAPTLYQLFSEYGNQALRPERANGWEAGVEQRFLDGHVALGATYFERRSNDLIIYNGCSTGAIDSMCLVPGSTTQRRFGYYKNVSRAFANGIEAAGHVALGKRLTIDGNYSWTASEDRSPGVATFGRQLPRRPRHAWNASADYSFPGGPSFGAAVRWSGDTFDSATSNVVLASYTLVDLRAELPVTPGLRLFVRGENVFDEKYETVYRYGTLGRSIYAGFRGRF